MGTKIQGLPMQKEWTVTGVREGNEVDNPNGPGKLKAFYVDFEGAPDVYWRRKMPATVEIGQSYFGTISEGDRGPRFKKENPGGSGGVTGGGGSRGGSAPKGAREWKPESQYDPEKVARMGRAHAQHMAILTCTAMGIFEGKDFGQISSKLKQWIDFFEGDVNATGQKAAQGVGSDGRTTASAGGQAAASKEPDPVPSQQSEGEDPEWILRTCEEAGLSSYPAGKLARFIARLSANDQKRAVAGLRDHDRQAATLTELSSSYAEYEGEPLPDSDPAEDDIPF